MAYFGTAWANTRKRMHRLAARRPNPTEAAFLAMLQPDVSEAAARFLWKTTLFYIEPRFTPHPDDDLVSDLWIDDGDWSMYWPRDFAEQHGFDEMAYPDWPKADPVTLRNYGLWLDEGMARARNACPRMIDRLSDGERACLRLLAVGHDVKSTAAALGVSAAAVTERLRGARAKLGVTSSREAARILAEVEAQNSWPMFSGLPHASEPPDSLPARGRHWPEWGVPAMIALTSLFTGAALWHLLSAPPTLPGSPPHVVATLPRAGATIAPGPFVLRVFFDREMADQSWSFVKTDKGAYPDCPGAPQRSADGRSFTLYCTAKPRTRYAIAFNGGAYRNFRSLYGGVSAQPYLLTFSSR